MNLTGKRVTIVGMGESGKAAAALLSERGAIVSIVDDQVKESPCASWGASVTLQCGDWDPRSLLSEDLVVVSPGVPLSRLPLAELNARKIEVMGELELASRFLDAPIIAITGTNGKSTTTTLVSEILKASSFRVFLGGNIGTPLSLAVGHTWDFIVVEVSSFQLETIKTFRPKIAAILNVTEDHLNRHGTLEQYGAIKRRIYENQKKEDYAVFHLRDPLSSPQAAFSVPVGFDPSETPSHTLPATRALFMQGDTLLSNLTGATSPVISRREIQLFGAHNVENVMAAVAISQLAGASRKAITEVLARFSGLPHRMEKVGERGGVLYINDSKGTNVGAALAALRGMTRPVIWIAGGLAKGADFTPLRAALSHVRGVIVMGQAAEPMRRAFEDHPCVRQVASMKDAVISAAREAQPGDVVLLSPACASFDMFRNFEHRGDCFKQAVLEL